MTVAINCSLECMFFIITLCHYLNPVHGPCAFFLYLRALFFIVLHQHPLMVQSSSSSKSNHSQSKSTHTAFKVGPPGKKTNSVSMDKAKKNKQSIKKYMHTGNYFICWAVVHLTLKLLLIRWKRKTSQEWSEHGKFASSVKKTER